LQSGKLNISSTSGTPQAVHKALWKNQKYKIYKKRNYIPDLINDRLQNLGWSNSEQEIENFN
jgi:hypothetical protein